MKLRSIFLVLLCYLSSLMHASKSSSEDISVNDGTTSSSTDLARLPATAESAPLRDNRIYGAFITELTLETISLTATVAASKGSVGCVTPELLTAALVLTAALYATKIGSLIPRAKLICGSAGVAAGRVRLTPARQAAISSASATIDCLRACAVLWIAAKSPYCEVGARKITPMLSDAFFCIIMLGIIQLFTALLNMFVWERDMNVPLPSETLQE